MLARDRFQTETPNVIDPGECPPLRPSRLGDDNTGTKEGAESYNSGNGSRGLSLSRYGSSGIKHSLYTRNGNKGALSRGIPIRCAPRRLEDEDDHDDYDDYNDYDNYDDDTDGSEDTIVFERTNAFKREMSFLDEQDSFLDSRRHGKINNRRFFTSNEEDEEENGIAQARLFAAAMLNESEKRQLSKRDLMSGSNDRNESSSTLRQMMNRASSFRKHKNDVYRTAATATVRASSYRNINASHPSQTLNRASSLRHIPIDNSGNMNVGSNRTIDRKHLQNIWLVDDTPDVSKMESGWSKRYLLRQKLVQAIVCLFVAIVVITIFALTAAKSHSPFSIAGGNLHSTAAGISSDTRLGKIVEFLVETTSISSIEDLYNSSSPQFRAAKWLADDDYEMLAVPIEMGVATANTDLVSSFNFVQRYVLLVLYFAFGGDDVGSNWTNDYHFASQDQHECSWYKPTLLSNSNENGMNYDDSENASTQRLPQTAVGLDSENNDDKSRDTNYFIMGVSCDRQLRVRSLSLPANNLKGSIPSEIQFLSTLVSLDFSNNSLVGPIPEELKNLVHLTHLDLSNNSLTGHIAPLLWLGKMLTQLETLDLSNNLLDLVGQKTSYNRRQSLGGEIRLKVLSLGGNIDNIEDIDGGAHKGSENTISIPDEIRYLTNLQELSLENSNIGGRIPAWLFHELNELRFLDLSSNQLTGSITDVFPVANGSSALKHLNSLLLHDNRLTGTLPDTIGLMPDLTTVTIHHTNMTVGTNAANLICWRGDASLVLESLTTNCGDATCPCCTEDCCNGKECYRDVDWRSGSSFSINNQKEYNKDEDGH